MFCECTGSDCVRELDVTIGEQLRIRAAYPAEVAIIAPDCPHGAEPGEEVLERTSRYVVVRDSLTFTA